MLIIKCWKKKEIDEEEEEERKGRRGKRGREEEEKKKQKKKKEEEGYQLANFISLNPVVVLAAPATQDSFHQRSKAQSASKFAVKSDKRVPSFQGSFPLKKKKKLVGIQWFPQMFKHSFIPSNS